MAVATYKWASLLSRTACSPLNARLVLIRVEIFLKTGIRLLRIISTCLTFFPAFLRLSKLFPRWLYRYFLAVDANFRLKLKNRGINDPEIGTGWSYFVESEEYNKHITQNTVETEVGSFRFFILTSVPHVF